MKKNTDAGKPPASRADGAKSSRLTAAGGKPAAQRNRAGMEAATLHNRERQLNPNHPGYWKSRGLDTRPSDWQTQAGRPARNRSK